MQKVIDSSLEFGDLNIFREDSHSTQWFVLKLKCGHIVGRYTNPKNEKPPKKVLCEYCTKNERAIQKNYDYTSDKIGWGRYSNTGLPKKCNFNIKNS